MALVDDLRPEYSVDYSEANPNRFARVGYNESMASLKERVLEEISKLPEDAQDAVWMQILEDIESERRWEEAFEKSQDKLSKLASKIRADIKAGKRQALNLDDL